VNKDIPKKTIENLLSNLIASKADSIIIFLSPGVYESLIPLFKTQDFSLPDVFFAVSDKNQMESISNDFPAEQILNSVNIDFIDRVKIITKGEGFQEVVVLSDSPMAVKQALGVARIFGTVHLFFAPSDTVKADLHNTIHYKSLKVKGYPLTKL